MDDDKENITVADDDELNTTAPNPPADEWRMPEPVFRRTSGKLPRGFEKQESAAAPETASAPTELATPEPVKSPVLKIVLVLLALGAMIGFIVAFLTILYFFFWRSAA